MADAQAGGSGGGNGAPQAQGPIEKLITNSAQQPEVTKLSPIEEVFFQTWAAKSGIKDLENGKYDYRGFYKANGPVPYQWGVDHLPDTFKQHGHPTFSVESKYSKGPHDGGMWQGEHFFEQPKAAVSHEQKLEPGVQAAFDKFADESPEQAPIVKTLIQKMSTKKGQ